MINTENIHVGFPSSLIQSVLASRGPSDCIHGGIEGGWLACEDIHQIRPSIDGAGGLREI